MTTVPEKATQLVQAGAVHFISDVIAVVRSASGRLHAVEMVADGQAYRCSCPCGLYSPAAVCSHALAVAYTLQQGGARS